MQRYSKQRATILDILKSTKRHPTANEIYSAARQVIPNISLGTVYRNLAQLSAAGEIMALKSFDGSEHFDAFSNPHPHLHCKSCNTVVDLEIPFMADFVEMSADYTGCDFEGHNIMFYGCCKDCK